MDARWQAREMVRVVVDVEMPADLTPSFVQAQVHVARAKMIECRRAGLIKAAVIWAERYRTLIQALALLTGKRYPVPTLAKCLRQG